MKTGIHPTYNEKATITCACGAIFTTGSVLATTAIDICSQCHPFYTGKKKFIDVTGRVERFKKLTELSQAKSVALQPKKARAPKKSVETKDAK
ncbi:MAG: 50S ribosomal protein L31 [Candidatus Moranbacteria bacterium]|jgi:large subunit ribosomal protein L31|nr:50S ribosomal protein L31 [Candidatus Moranbacteria bacterium]